MAFSDEGGSGGPLPSSLVPRWLAAAVLVVILAAGVFSAWLVVNADLGAAAREGPAASPPEGEAPR